MVDSKILIVEEDFIVAIDLKIHLEKMGYNVIDITDNGEDTLNKTREKSRYDFKGYQFEWYIDRIDTAKQIIDLYGVPVIN